MVCQRVLRIAQAWLCLPIDVFINVRHIEGTCAFVGLVILTVLGVVENFPWFLRDHLLLAGRGSDWHPRQGTQAMDAARRQYRKLTTEFITFNHIYRSQTKFRDVIFSQTSGCAWERGYQMHHGIGHMVRYPLASDISLETCSNLLIWGT